MVESCSLGDKDEVKAPVPPKLLVGGLGRRGGASGILAAYANTDGPTGNGSGGQPSTLPDLITYSIQNIPAGAACQDMGS